VRANSSSNYVPLYGYYIWSHYYKWLKQVYAVKIVLWLHNKDSQVTHLCHFRLSIACCCNKNFLQSAVSNRHWNISNAESCRRHKYIWISQFLSRYCLNLKMKMLITSRMPAKPVIAWLSMLSSKPLTDCNANILAEFSHSIKHWQLHETG